MAVSTIQKAPRYVFYDVPIGTANEVISEGFGIALVYGGIYGTTFTIRQYINSYGQYVTNTYTVEQYTIQRIPIAKYDRISYTGGAYSFANCSYVV